MPSLANGLITLAFGSSGGLPGLIRRSLMQAGSSEEPPRPPERDDNFAVEPRSRQWQFFGRAWNECCMALRNNDLLTDAELQARRRRIRSNLMSPAILVSGRLLNDEVK